MSGRLVSETARFIAWLLLSSLDNVTSCVPLHSRLNRLLIRYAVAGIYARTTTHDSLKYAGRNYASRQFSNPPSAPW